MRAASMRSPGGKRLRRRGWLVRRTLLTADVLGLVVAFSLAQLLLDGGGTDHAEEWLALVVAIPLWIVMGKLYGLYDRDEERAAHSTVDDVVGVFHLVTIGAWLLLLLGRVTGADEPAFWKVAGFWLLAIVLITTARAVGRAMARRSALYIQNTVIAGAGDVGQLVARKVAQHPEYGINLVGFVDDDPRPRRREIAHVPVLAPMARAASGRRRVRRRSRHRRLLRRIGARERREDPVALRRRRADRHRPPPLRRRRPEGDPPLDRGAASRRPSPRPSLEVVARGEAAAGRRRRHGPAARHGTAVRRDRAAHPA